jgi:hypothetical protein
MKKKCTLFLYLIIFCGMCSSNDVRAQNNQNSNAFKKDMDSRFMVNRPSATTGLLKDFGLLIADVAKFNGVNTTSNFSSRAIQSALYASVYFMRFDTVMAFGTPKAYRIKDSTAYRLPTVTKLTALHYRYDQIKSNAVSSNLLSVSNGKIYDVPGRQTTPYEFKELFAMAAIKEELYGNSQIFRFASDLFYRNVTKPISTIKIDFADGVGYRTIALDTDITITYNTDGIKNLLYKITYTDGQVVESHSKVWIVDVGSAVARYSSPVTLNFPTSSGFPAPAAQMGAATVSIYYGAGTPSVLDKPLIMIEGFDPKNSYNPREALQALDITINFDYPNQTLNQALQDNGYDLIFVNFANATDDIIKNSWLLENLIAWVNANRVGTQKNVVMGISMGGLISTYALRDMELRGVNTGTRLHCTVDSPHNGAVVPLGAQAAVRYLANAGISFVKLRQFIPDLAEGMNLLNTPAAQQMLYHQMSGAGTNIAYTQTPYAAFHSQYKTMGLPRLNGIRNIAIANGSECNQGQPFTNNALLLSATGNKDIGYFAGLLAGTIQTFATLNPLRFYEGFIATNTDLRMNMEVRALPGTNAANQIFKFKLDYRKELLGGLITSTQTLLSMTVTANSTLIPLDNSAGGYYDINKFAAIPTSLPGFNMNVAQPAFCFVPVFSSLNIGAGTQPITNSDIARAYSITAPPAAPKNIPYANYITAPVSNEFHTQFTTVNGRWLMNEIMSVPSTFTCSANCADTNVSPYISGPNNACGQDETYSLINPPPGASISWTKSANLNIVSGQNTTALVVRPTADGDGWVQVSINGSCGLVTLPQKTFPISQLGIHTNQVAISGPTGVCPNVNYYQFCTSNTSGVPVTLYEWQVPSGWTITSQTANCITVSTGLDVDLQTVEVYLTSRCQGRQGPWTYTVVDQGNCGSGFAMSPNPSSESVSVTVPESSAAEVRQKENDELTLYEVRIVDPQGNDVYRKKQRATLFAISTAELKEGIYIVETTNSENTSRRRLVIKH